MAVTRREFIFGAFLSSVVCVVLISTSIASDNWVTALATHNSSIQAADSKINYGLFRGELELNIVLTPTYHTLYLTCVFDEGACAVSCKTNPEARKEEVLALANRRRPITTCVSVTTVDSSPLLDEAPIIPSALYVCVCLFVFLHLVGASVGAGLAVTNAARSPTEPACGLPGCLWANVVTGCLGVLVMMMFGIFYATTLQRHLAFSLIATGTYVPRPSLGYSYWCLFGSILCSALNVALLETRKYLLERDPPPPTIKVENHSDGTIFLY